ncbi:hypothetical protein PoB_004481500 [Plakobranchus ocellatus]|uniref:Secreted protein n=1 Tax=Plakobranchus ocellatus TaxID=259542 RepID=A0AAV4BCF9_9GAST|nr:hypothetical protein PoB_004481500 [Plakobranchus ocellatus]
MICEIKNGLVLHAATVSRLMPCHVTVSLFALSNRATDVRPGCCIRKIALTFDNRKDPVDLACFRTKETRVFPNMYSCTSEVLPPVCSRPYTRFYTISRGPC